MGEEQVTDERAEPVVTDVAPSAADLPPQPLDLSALSVVRKVDAATGYVFTYYVDSLGQRVPLGETRSLQKASAGFQPPPS
jgi:hypothetical protein